MKIALLGYGKMGKAIGQAAVARGHEIALTLSSSNASILTPKLLKQADVALEVSTPQSARHHVLTCFEAGIPVVCGTTGWPESLEEIRRTCLSGGHAFLYTSNFSIGVNLFFRLNELLARLMESQPGYRPLIEETHHVHKKDAPSGTALTLVSQILDQVSRLRGWTPQEPGPSDLVPVISHREDEVPGTHRVLWKSDSDSLEVIHTAYNREGFAQGAVTAAEWILGKKGVFSMSDVLGTP
ncbi:MAG TPA: 4-hydroxy-tetrahydrodipicolinate reductase [Chitinophagaceae bacterium]|nr:4-hydroxy-tetrahydrodipicolinate reductase [Chitinophagaceae bacterium]